MKDADAILWCLMSALESGSREAYSLNLQVVDGWM